MVLGNFSAPGHTTIWTTVGQGPIAHAVGAGCGLFGHFYSPLFLSNPLAGKRDIVTIFVRCMFVRPSEFFWTITCTIMHGFQNNLAQLLPLSRSAI